MFFDQGCFLGVQFIAKGFVQDNDDPVAGHPGCIVATAVYQDRLFDRDVREANRRAVLGWRNRFRAMFEEVAKVYPLNDGADLEHLADMVSSVIEGGIVMALGYALTESYIIEDGVPWTTLLARYKMPSIKHAPEIVSHLVEHRVSTGPYGAKGVGEIPSINTTPAIANAIYNAVGVRVYSIPVDQDALLRAIKAGETELHQAWHDVK